MHQILQSLMHCAYLDIVPHLKTIKLAQLAVVNKLQSPSAYSGQSSCKYTAVPNTNKPYPHPPLDSYKAQLTGQGHLLGKGPLFCQYSQVSSIYPSKLVKQSDPSEQYSQFDQKYTSVPSTTVAIGHLPYIVQLNPTHQISALQYNKQSKSTLRCPWPPSTY